MNPSGSERHLKEARVEPPTKRISMPNCVDLADANLTTNLTNGTLPPCPPHHPGPYDGNVVLGVAKLLLMVLALVAGPIMCCIVVRAFCGLDDRN